MTGAAILMALAGKANYTPPQPCIDYADVMKAAGPDVEVHVYASGYHDFGNTVLYFTSLSNAQTSRNCPSSEIDPVTWEYRLVASGQRFKRYQDFVAAVNYANCQTTGVVAGNDFGLADKAEEAIRRFVTRVFQL